LLNAKLDGLIFARRAFNKLICRAFAPRRSRFPCHGIARLGGGENFRRQRILLLTPFDSSLNRLIRDFLNQLDLDANSPSETRNTTPMRSK
jgi:hypothetical protein